MDLAFAALSLVGYAGDRNYRESQKYRSLRRDYLESAGYKFRIDRPASEGMGWEPATEKDLAHLQKLEMLVEEAKDNFRNKKKLPLTAILRECNTLAFVHGKSSPKALDEFFRPYFITIHKIARSNLPYLV